MNKKYQVFVSSTYKDLKEERMAVIRLLLKMGFIPVGMEQFPASNMSQMEYIKMMLDSCDYYLLILAGKYGSVDVDGIGFTEKEYDYAIANGIPVMSILVEDIGKLENAKCEDTDAKRELLMKFRESFRRKTGGFLYGLRFTYNSGCDSCPFLCPAVSGKRMDSWRNH